MKRLLLFVSIFGAGLLILVFALGPGRLLRRTPTTSIEPQDLPPAPDAISISTSGQRIGFGIRGAGTIPFWTQVAQPDGSALRVKSAQLKYSTNEPHFGGVHLTSPVLDLFEGKAADEKAIARVVAAGGELETEGDLHSLAESLKQQQLKSFSMSPDVHLSWLGDDGRPALTIETSQLDIPESPPGPETPPAPEPPTGPDATQEGDEARRLLFPKLVAPNPVHIFQADGGFDLNAAALEMQRFDGRLELKGPVTLNATHFNLPTPGASAGKAKPAEAPSNRPPVTLTCDGHATFVQRPPEKPDGLDKPEKPERKSGQKGVAKAATREPGQAIGPGTLTFERNVVVRQTDPATNDERWLRTDRLVLELENDANGQLTVKSLDAGGGAEPSGQVIFGLLGGEGGARHLKREGNDLVLDGPVHLDRMTVGRGADARLFSLAAEQKLVLHEETSSDGPSRWRAELYGAAHATSQDELDAGWKRAKSSQDELDADGDQLTALLRKVEQGDAAGGNAGSFDVDELVIDGHARLDMHARGKASAQKITLGGGGRAARKAHLEGDAVVTSARGTLRAPTIDLTIPEGSAAGASSGQALRGSTPRMTDGRMALPAGGSLFGGEETAIPEGGPPPRPRELRLEPLPEAPVALEVFGEELHLRGRTRVHLFELAAGDAPERETQQLTADSLDLLPQAGGAPQVVADGSVDVVDLERGFHLEAAHAHTELAADGDRHLLLDGAPAKATIALPVVKSKAREKPGEAAEPKETAELTLLSRRLDVDLLTRRIVADDREHLVSALVPEALVGSMLPSIPSAGAGGEGANASPPPIQFDAEHVDVVPQELTPAEKSAKRPPALAATATSDNPFLRALVTARGRVHALRQSDGSTFDADRMVLDLAASRARLDGEPGVPVKLLRPKSYAPDRVEQVITDWIEAVDGGAKVTMAPRRDDPVIILFPEQAPESGSEKGKVPQRMRVALRCSDPPVLTGDTLLLTGGVDTDLEIGDARDPGGVTKAHSRSERVEVTLSGSLGSPNLTLHRLTAQGRVRLDYERAAAVDASGGEAGAVACHAEGARLTFDLVKGDLVMKEGVEPCRLLAAEESGGWRSTATFGLMKGNLLELEAQRKREGRSRKGLLSAELPPFHFEDIHLVAEGPHER